MSLDSDKLQKDNARHVIVFAGPNGSGKSTIKEDILAFTKFQGEYINADDIARSLTSEIPDYRERNIKAAEMAEKRRQQAMQEGRPFSFETVMSTPEKVAILTQAKAHGYDVSLLFVTTDDPEKNVSRVEDRVAKGGHPVDPDAVRRRYHDAMALLPCAVEHADVALIMDNSQGGGVDVAIKADGTLQKIADKLAAKPPPQWVDANLIAPYQERMQSRDQIGRAFSAHASKAALLLDADASHGQSYRGQVVEVTQYHVLQQIQPNQFIIHDRALSVPQALEPGQQATIGYTYDKGKIKNSEVTMEARNDKSARQVLEYGSYKELVASPEAHAAFLQQINVLIPENGDRREFFQNLKDNVKVNGEPFSQVKHLTTLENSSERWDLEESPDALKLTIAKLSQRFKTIDSGYDLAHFTAGYEYALAEMKGRGLKVENALNLSEFAPDQKVSVDHDGASFSM